MASSLTRAGTVKVDPATLATSAAGIFAGGDVAFGPRNLIEAIANGKQAALSIDNYLRDVKGGPEIRFSIRKISTRDYRMPRGLRAARTPGSSDHADRPAHRIFRSRDGLLRTGGASAGGAVPFMPHPDHLRRRQVRPVQPLCGRLPGVLSQARAARSTGPGRGAGKPRWHTMERAERLAYRFSAMIKDDDKCIRCGLCAIRCPTDAMTMEVFFYEESEAACK